MNQNQEFQIDLLKLAATLWSRILAILLVGAIFAFAGFAYTASFVSPTYTASTSMFVNNSKVSIGSSTVSGVSVSTNGAWVDSYLFILRSRTTLEDVIARAELPYSYGALSGMISTSMVEGTSAFVVSVTSRNPTEAALIANTIAEVLPERISEIIDGSSPRIVDYAIVPSHRSGPNYLRNTTIGFAVGALLTIVIISVRFLIDERNDMAIHSADELRQLYPDIQVLALIPDMRLSDKKGYYYSSYYGEKKKGAS